MVATRKPYFTGTWSSSMTAPWTSHIFRGGAGTSFTGKPSTKRPTKKLVAMPTARHIMATVERRLNPFMGASLLPNPLQKRLELARARRVAQFAERLGFDLPDALARDGEVLADLFERVLAAVRAAAEAHLDDLLFARREGRQNLLRDLAQVRDDDGVRGVEYGLILDEVAEVRVLLLADGRLK